jgi:hypothetical protein
MLEMSRLAGTQTEQTMDQYRMNIYQEGLKFNLLLKMLAEKGIFAQEEFEKRWPLFLKNDVGVLGPDGRMEGTLKVTMYGIS